MRRVGILGGMGPEATLLIMQKVLAGVTATDDADHIPLIVDQNPQVPSRIAHLIEGTGADPGPVLAEMAQRLVAGGAEALAMPCNTAHHYAGAIKAAVGVPFLDMIALSAAHAARVSEPGSSVGILGSPAVRKVALFEAALERYGLTALYPQNEDATLGAIRQIKADGPQPEARHALARASAELLDRGAEVQMIACTEFSLIPEAVASDATSFDTLDRLVIEILSFSTMGRNA
ncbi:aspartate/glutamate racemase family protein [Palleronia caenipelagi]|uniref:Aspartate/glutamate racemase family protein n=1 Tax=Palleronia caenipelagi TaxID=2489174 RepID=A0A547Q920_9RHOB|nr:amino acid racemase [Palleronia caenipelagi]TRD22871.1 aspartate/glutamate racemase family protein [Palleronia caenipelagi]